MRKLLLLLVASTVFPLAHSQEWAGHERYAAANAAITKAPEVVFMGNSITDLWDDNHPEFFTDNNFACRGISGQVTSQMLCRFYSDVVDLKPKSVVILAGINDIAQNKGPIELEHIAQNIMSMAEIARQNGIRPFIASVLPCDTIPWNAKIVNTSAKVAKLNEMLSKYAADNGITYIDYFSPLVAADGSLDSRYTNDRIHPNRAGYDVMEPVVLKALAEKQCCRKACDKKPKADCRDCDQHRKCHRQNCTQKKN